MKKYLLFAALTGLIISFTGCKNQKKDNSTASSSTDDRYNPKNHVELKHKNQALGNGAPGRKMVRICTIR